MIKKIVTKVGMDRAIFYTAAARIFQSIGGIVTVLLIAIYMDGVEQGFYYTFASILALQVFFELGLTSIITQYVAHEKAHLTQVNDELLGEEKHRSRIAYLLRFCLKWYSILAAGIFVSITVSGYVFFLYFYTSDQEVSWKLPWVLLVFGSSINFLLAPISSLLEGLGKVKEIAGIRLVQQIITQTAVWGGLLLGFKLYVVVLAPFLGAGVFMVLVGLKFFRLIKHIANQRITYCVSYRKEIFPYQWRVALSWVSGYFIFQLFNPVLFATEGAIVAGQMGMTLTALNAIMSLSDSWISTKVPVMSGYIATKNYIGLDKLFTIIQRQSIFIVTVCCLFFISCIWIIDSLQIELAGKLLSQRFLPYIPVVIMASTVVMRQFQSSWAVYMRCHKKEPLMWVSIIMSITCMMSTFILGNLYGVDGMTAGYAILTLCSTIAIYIIFKQKRVLWHQS